MRKRILGCALALAFVATGCPTFIQPTCAHRSRVSFSDFHHRLSPYGHWVRIPRYGWVWRPTGVGRHWQPYTNGYWAHTRYGWTWVSYFEWGDIPFHYGAWDWVSGHGWVWVPGYVWAPAWVTWRYGDWHIGWAPLPPGYRFRAGRDCPAASVSDRAWVFVPTHHAGHHRISSARVDPYRNVELTRSTRPLTHISVVDNHIINSGPELEMIERQGKYRIRRAEAEHLGITPRPLAEAGPSREVTVATPFQSRTLTAQPVATDERREREFYPDRSYGADEVDREDRISPRPEIETEPEVAPRRRASSVRSEASDRRHIDERRIPEETISPRRERRKPQPDPPRLETVNPGLPLERFPVRDREDPRPQPDSRRLETTHPVPSVRSPTPRQDQSERPEKSSRRVIREMEKSPRTWPSGATRPAEPRPDAAQPRADRLPDRPTRSTKPIDSRAKPPVN